MTPNHSKQVKSFSVTSQSAHGAVRALSGLQQVLPVTIVPSSSLKCSVFVNKSFQCC